MVLARCTRRVEPGGGSRGAAAELAVGEPVGEDALLGLLTSRSISRWKHELHHQRR